MSEQNRVQPLINELLSIGYSVQLEHVTKETSWEDTEEHGYVALKSSAGDELVRKGGFQHNRKLRSGGSWDPKGAPNPVLTPSHLVPADCGPCGLCGLWQLSRRSARPSRRARHWQRPHKRRKQRSQRPIRA